MEDQSCFDAPLSPADLDPAIYFADEAERWLELFEQMEARAHQAEARLGAMTLLNERSMQRAEILQARVELCVIAMAFMGCVIIMLGAALWLV